MGEFSRRLISTRAEAALLLGWLEESSEIVLDIETAHQTDLLSLAIVFLDGPHGNKTVSYCAPGDLCHNLADYILSPKSRLMVWGHWVQYDLGFLANWSAPERGELRVIRCLAGDSAAEDFFRREKSSNGRSLKVLAEEAGQEKFDEDRGSLADLPMEQLARYNCQDTLIVPPIVDYARRARSIVGETSPYPTALYSVIIPFITQIEASGFAWDFKAAEEARRWAADMQVSSKQRLFDLIGEEINLNSYQQKAWAFYGRYSGLPEDEKWESHPSLHLKPHFSTEKGKSGVYSTNKDALEALSETQPELSSVHEWVLADKMRAALDNIPQWLRNGLVYPSFDMYRIVSGRIAVTDPPMQTFSAKKMPMLKRCFISRYGDKGRILKMDGSQMELRWGAMESGCQYLIQAYLEGRDFHQETADAGGVDRALGKTINFASVYGCSLKKLIALGLSEDAARSVLASMKENWKELYDYEDQLKREIIRWGKTCTAYGMYRRTPGVSGMYDPEVRSAVNFRFQMPASHLTQLLGAAIMWSVRDEDRIHPVMTEHDGLSFDVHEEDEHKLVGYTRKAVEMLPDLAKTYMCTDLTIPFVFELTSGPNWLDQEPLTEFSTG